MSWNRGVAGVGAAASTDVEAQCARPITDPVSCMAWAPPELAAQGKNLLAVGGWDKMVRIWNVSKDTHAVQSQPVQPDVQADMPVLATAWNHTGGLFYGGCCQTAKMINLAAPGTPPQQVAQHDLPIKSMVWCQQSQVLATGGWDGCVKVWDCKSPTAGATINVNAPVVDMSIVDNMCFVATARKIIILDLVQMREVHRMDPLTNMAHQIRCIAAMPNKAGFAIGSIEGRVCIMYLNNQGSTVSFPFVAHRDPGAGGRTDHKSEVFSVNSLSFAQIGTSTVLATAGSNGTVAFWDKDTKKRLSASRNLGSTVACGAFSRGQHNTPAGGIYAYATSYDWTKGAAHYIPSNPSRIMLKKYSK